MSYSIKAPKGATKKRRIVGRGIGSTVGGTSRRGENGQKSRSGGGVRPGFEGGQMPLYRRIAVRGFSNARFKTDFYVINLDRIDKAYNEGETVSMDTMREKGLVKGKKKIVKILGSGEMTKKLTFDYDKISASAIEKIKKAGGTITTKEEK
ncbi:MAG: 50S ribosomal protein L15 [Spirochaetales bacterium]|nr:50S ribosomal protein L15 [Spirochaetales bacterium]